LSLSRPVGLTARGRPALYGLQNQVGGIQELGPPSIFHSKSVLYGAFVWARRALNIQKQRFPARAVSWCHPGRNEFGATRSAPSRSAILGSGTAACRVPNK
jgi:hypothetical protein